MTEVFDLDAAVAERTVGPYLFKFRGRLDESREWSLRPMQELDLDVVERADSGDLAAVRAAISDAMDAEQFAEFKQAGGFTLGPLDVLFRQWLEHCGLEPGKSESAAPSSPNMARRPRQTRSGRAGR